jgi:predicted nucleic acid-binding protein
MTTLVDTDILIGLTITTDAHYERVNALYTKILTDTTLYLLPSTLGEFATLATIKIGRELTQKAVTEIAKSHTLITLDEQCVHTALMLYYKQTSKENSLFDCYIMAAAKQLSVNYIFSFDSGYPKNGFTIIEEWLNIPY